MSQSWTGLNLSGKCYKDSSIVLPVFLDTGVVLPMRPVAGQQQRRQSNAQDHTIRKVF